MSEHADLPGRPTASKRVAAAEADIAETRRRLDDALSDIRHEVALPLAAVKQAATALGGADDATRLAGFVRRNAAPLGLIALGAAWLAVQCRGALGAAGSGYARELLDQARDLGARAAQAALSAAAAQLSRTDGSSGAPVEPPPRDPGAAPH